ncbi:Extracellular ligand-binding receptor [Sulfurimonas denitrificans DSM 1251]|uniref:Extracellular ligand-binding receptor n=1 Tax=Sulfurimonas denitrificans (strain ATCC 33889 / DSM 1251) TaxID=326298 RepID=Q30SC7_SULDN|nr:ABC transporter substrate-binding protein [Sulfurimonas denitrificans]ABB44104.1 Extracellular ligand-binding receptor [Sulfurimonas denitrificans DSM 1251]
MIRYIVALSGILIFFYFIPRDDKFDQESLKLGISVPSSGIMKAWGSAVYSGADSYFLHVNENNLLSGKKIFLVVCDDKYEPELTIENIKKLIDEKIFVFFGFVGTPTVKKILPILQEEKIPLIAPFSGAEFLRDEKYEHFINFRSSYKEEIDAIVKYLYEKKGVKRFAVFYQNDDYGEEGFVSLLESLDKRDLELSGEGTYKRNTLSIKHALYEIKSAKPEAVLMVGAHKANAIFIKTAKLDETFKDTYFCNISFGDADEMIKELDKNTTNLLFSEVAPNYKNSELSVVLEYKELMKKYYPNQALGFISFESFLAAKTVVAALQNIDGSITRDKFLSEIKNLQSDSLGGLEIDFKNRQLHNKIYLYRYENSNFIEVKNED